MEKFKTLNETELISVVGGKPKKKRSLCPYVATAGPESAALGAIMGAATSCF